MNFDFMSYIRPKLSECLNFVKLALEISGFIGMELASLQDSFAHLNSSTDDLDRRTKEQ
jgi:hypothetical protein